MANGSSWTKSFFVGIWTVLNFCRKAFFNIIFIILAIGFIAMLMKDDGKVLVPKSTALVLNIEGDIVIEKRYVDPMNKFLEEAFGQEPENPEVLLKDVLFALENAKHDNRVKTLILQLQGMGNVGMDKMKQVAMAIDDFKESGKPVYAIADYYTQSQYYLASKADKVYMNPMGAMMFEGYGRYPTYYKAALEKLKVTTHVFKVGTYKSAVEPYIRDDMSEPAKEANKAWLTVLWNQYKADVAAARNLSTSAFDEDLDQFLLKFEQVDGDFAAYAMENGWVDGLPTREAIRQEIIDIVGEDKNHKSFSQISLNNYLKVIKPIYHLPQVDVDHVAIVVAKGTILNGTQKAGDIGGDSTAELLRKARLDDSVKAVVLYVDSPGGSAFASEIIRQEVENLKTANKPVVALMSTYGASGGYWISAAADEIWAAPSTVTGSIGIFGMFMTFENTLDYLGIHSDGVGTTDFSGLNVTRALDPRVGRVIQMSINHGYQDFLNLVAKERNMTVEAVDKIAQGRVWIGETAKELGLVDNLGFLDDAVSAAADLAKLENYETKYVERDLSPSEKFWKEFLGQASQTIGHGSFAKKDSALAGFVKQLVEEVDAVTKLNDPNGVYAHCLACEIN
ncbi:MULTISPECIES: signal peptide peptidase SppA [Aliiglaciecola]|uniref:signal peptide peptidase SppA n=1 Tax=Aliiglaciecola TaxID=1406885 RepID=UPI001C09DB1D|nr:MULTISPECIES: signal peptide peptidase SppA [Aliiglaciecola]MBU2877190.1 signal peptide peptidase SppA [Aliiglaciecola lipolytica]MDO6712120.1 signal peptide peptidase SppA [Aliiglaciecola sp. 2_MG-2023]MDO6753200.1 signal peptide peptidase SppA [Aliiglaciecola sp. 1_MG-2023]